MRHAFSAPIREIARIERRSERPDGRVYGLLL
jgi:hypothetical protein